MAEEVKDQNEEKEVQEEQKETQEVSETSEESKDRKEKKINRLSIEQLNAKISEMETKSLTQSVYYKHLLQRKKELESA